MEPQTVFLFLLFYLRRTKADYEHLLQIGCATGSSPAHAGILISRVHHQSRKGIPYLESKPWALPSIFANGNSKKHGKAYATLKLFKGQKCNVSLSLYELRCSLALTNRPIVTFKNFW